MKKIKLNAKAKINLTLDVLGVTNNYHDIKSLVTSVDVFDRITVKKRRDGRITLKTEGLPVGCSVHDNNAYKAAKLFKEEFGTKGVDILIEKRIPIGSGLGGSSADIAGVLNAMKALYEVDGDLIPLANALGSDSAYMLTGGYALMTGRGDKVVHKKINTPLYFILITEPTIISARASYKKFDELGKTSKQCTAIAEKALKDNDFDKFCSVIKNDLQDASAHLVPEINGNIYLLKKAGAPAALMTGSGAAVYGVFNDKKSRDDAYKKLLPLCKENMFKVQTVQEQ